MKKKILLLVLLSFFFLIPSVNAADSYQQIFSTDELGTLTTLDGLMTYDIGAGAKFTYYQFKFVNTLEKGKTYHVKINLFGTLSDGFYQFDKTAWEFSSYDADFNKVDKLNAYDLQMTGSGQYRSIEFDFYNATDYHTYRLAAANPDGMLYYQWQGSGKFGWYSFNIEKINDSDDIIIAQNDLVIKNQQDTNKKLDDLDKNITNPDIDSNTGNDFFDNFNTSDNGGISGIVTAPLVLINYLLDAQDVCTDLSFKILGKDVSIPSGCIIWDDVPDNVEIIIQTLFCGTCSYFLLKKLFKDIDKLKNPNNSEVSTLDL